MISAVIPPRWPSPLFHPASSPNRAAARTARDRGHGPASDGARILRACGGPGTPSVFRVGFRPLARYQGEKGVRMAPEEEERSLVLRAQGGERPAFDRLFVLHRPRIESLIRSRLRTGLRQEAEVEDVLQETLLRAFRSIRRFAWEGEGSFLRWLGSIAEHLIVDLARRAERGPRAPLDPDVAGSGVTQSKALRREERFDRLQEALRTL